MASRAANLRTGAVGRVRVGLVRRSLVALGLMPVLAAPAFALAAEAPPVESDPPELTSGNVSPNAALSVRVDGTTVFFDASGSEDPDGTLALFEWDLDGDGVFEEDSGTEPALERDLPAGTTLIAGLRVRDDAGAADEATATVAVPAAEEPSDAVEPASVPATPAPRQPQLVDPAKLAESKPGPEPPAPPKPRKVRQRSQTVAADDPVVRPAASKSVTISDFEFAPATVNINVGDSVTWTNRGPTLHTATASDGSFDSGNLDRGERYSKTFTSPGTYSYICKPHPFMRGRVVVGGGGADSGGSGGGDSGGGSDGGSSGSGGDDATGSGTSSGDSSAGNLASTGADLIPWSVFGFSLLAFGAAMRLRLTAD